MKYKKIQSFISMHHLDVLSTETSLLKVHFCNLLNFIKDKTNKSQYSFICNSKNYSDNKILVGESKNINENGIK